MEQYTMFVKDGIITIQEADYIEDGFYIEVIGKDVTLFEIPLGGGEPTRIGSFLTIIDAIEYSKTLI